MNLRICVAKIAQVRTEARFLGMMKIIRAVWDYFGKRAWARFVAIGVLGVVLAVLERTASEGSGFVSDSVGKIGGFIEDIGMIGEIRNGFDGFEQHIQNFGQHAVLRLHSVGMEFDTDGNRMFDYGRSDHTVYFHAHPEAHLSFWYNYRCFHSLPQGAVTQVSDEDKLIPLEIELVGPRKTKVCVMQLGESVIRLDESERVCRAGAVEGETAGIDIGGLRRKYRLDMRDRWESVPDGDTDLQGARSQILREHITYCQVDLVMFARR